MKTFTTLLLGISLFTFLQIKAQTPWYLSGNTTGSNDYFGTYNNNDIRFCTNNASSSYASLKQKMIVSSGGNVGIGYDGTNSPVSPQNKLLVQNGQLGYNPYTITSGFGISSASIGIASFSKNASDGFNIPILSYAGFTPSTFSGSSHIGVATITSNAESNIGHYAIISGSSSGSSNTGFRAQIMGDGVNGNNGARVELSGNGAGGNNGVRVNLSGNEANSNDGVNISLSGREAEANAGVRIDMTGYKATFNNGIDISMSADSALYNSGIRMNITGNWNDPTLTQNTGVYEYIRGNGRTDAQFSPSSTANKGLHLDIAGETTRNLGAVLLVGGDGSSNIGASTHVYGTTSQPNVGFGARVHGSSSWNNGVYGGAWGNNSSIVGVFGEIRSGANDTDSFPPLQADNANSICIGVKGSIVNQGDGSQNYGVMGDLSAIVSPQNNVPYYAIYGIMPSSGSSSPTSGVSAQPRYAGYFNGDVFCANTYYYSDAKLKNNIRTYTGALEQIGKLSVKSYEFANREYSYMNMPQGVHVGLLSNEIKEVFPNLVKPAIQPETKTTPRVDFEAVNYVGLVPVLVEAVNELNQETSAKQDSIEKKIELLRVDNEKLYKKIEELNDIISNICATGCAGIKTQLPAIGNSSSEPVLYQNTPNPFSSETVIKFYIPNTFESAYILISDFSGKIINRLLISDDSKQGQFTISANAFSAGSYRYTLFVDEKMIDSKTMILTQR